MLYLSLLQLNVRSHEARSDLADCRALHCRLLHAFPDQDDITTAREQYGVLYRVESLDTGARILVQSRERPEWSRLPARYLRVPASEPKEVSGLYAQVTPGLMLAFRLRANPTRRISDHNVAEQKQWHGKRVELRKEADQLDWLRRKGEAAGFELVRVAIRLPSGKQDEQPDVRALDAATKVRSRRAEKPLTFGSVTFEGRLRVTDAATFVRALEVGIGSGKAFGFGLLSVLPAVRAEV